MSLLDVLFVVFTCFSVLNAAVFTDNEEESINTFISKVMECRQMPGLTVSVVRGSESWTRGFGMADLESRREVDENTLFAIGSVSKAFTMTLLLMVLEESNYNWDTKLSDIEGLDLQFPSEDLTKNATIADLLAHRTGLSAVTDYGFIGGYPKGTNAALMCERLKYVPQQDKFRSSFLYNNLMYVVLSCVTEMLGGDTWNNLMTSRVLETIGMDSSKIIQMADDMVTGNVAKPYVYKDDKFEDGDSNIYVIHPLEPAGSIMSTAVDMSKWMRFNLNNGSTFSGQQLVDPARFTEAFQVENDAGFMFELSSNKQPTFPVDDVNIGYGYGWFASTYRGYKRNWHSGGLFSYTTILWLFPEEETGICVSINGPAIPKSPGNGLKVILSFISDILLKLDPWLSSETGCTYPSPWVNATKFEIPPPKVYTNNNVSDLVGNYGNRLLPDIRIEMYTKEDGNQSLILNWNKIKGDLHPEADVDKFRFQMTLPWEYAIERVFSDTYVVIYPVTFERDDKGEVVSFNITLGAREVMQFRKGVSFLDETETGANTSAGSRFYMDGFGILTYIFVIMLFY